MWQEKTELNNVCACAVLPRKTDIESFPDDG